MWRDCRKEDVKRGLMIRIGNMADTAFSGATVIAVDEDTGYVRVARPMAFANVDYNSRQPDIHTEVFEMSIQRMCGANTDIEVYVDRDGNVRTMAHRAA